MSRRQRRSAYKLERRNEEQRLCRRKQAQEDIASSICLVHRTEHTHIRYRKGLMQRWNSIGAPRSQRDLSWPPRADCTAIFKLWPRAVWNSINRSTQNDPARFRIGAETCGRLMPRILPVPPG